MKPMSFFALSLAAGLVACSHAPVAPTTETAAPKVAPVAPTPVARPVPPPAPPAPVPVPTNSIFFDFDQSLVKPDAREALSTVGALLREHAELHVRVEGNCDERGTEEYNIALGQRRAEAARRYLLQLGAREGQVATKSWGEERPRAKGHDEESWQQNRRDDLIPDRATLQPRAGNP